MNIDHPVIAESSAAMKTASIATYSGAGAAIFAGLTPGDWQILGVIGGVVLGVASFFVNIGFKWAHYQLAKQRAGVPEAE